MELDRKIHTVCVDGGNWEKKEKQPANRKKNPDNRRHFL